MSWDRFQEINYISKSYKDAHVGNLGDMKEFALSFLKKPKPMMLMGKCGTGKTYFIMAIIQALLVCGARPLWQIKFSRAKSLSDRIDEEYKIYGTTKSEIQSCIEAPYLFIDDFGVQSRGERIERDFYEICDRRLPDGMPTIFSTNLEEEEIKEIFGARISSRLKLCQIITFTGPDRRN